MITLYTFPEAFGLRNVSPFCLKIEMALTYLGLDFEIQFQPDPRKAPKGKLPVVVIDGEKIPDSEIILEVLDKKTGGGLFGDLSPQEKAIGTAWTRLTEDHLYWMVTASRWLDDDWYPNIVKGFFGSLPRPIRSLVGWITRRQVRQTYHLHGLGRHSPEEQRQFARSDLRALSDAVGEGGYITGQRLTVYDFAVASLLAGMLDNKPTTWVNEIADEFPNLRNYAERVQKELGVYGRLTTPGVER